MAIESAWAYGLLLALMLGVVALPAFRAVDAADDPDTRHASIDGLRGFLALGVFGFHLVVTYGYLRTGRWQPPASGFYALLGPVGVSLFFMITGYLFWAKLLREHGRLRWRAFFVGRLCRIGPMYLVAVLVMLVVVFARTGPGLQVPAPQVAASIAQWLALGMIDTQPDVNGHPARHVLAGVTWTIFYEWVFYASLLVTAVVARGRHHLMVVGLALPLALAGVALLRVEPFGFAALFLCGMVVASLLHLGLRPTLAQHWKSLLALACLVLVFGLARGAYGGANALLLMLFFYLVCSDATLFGVLTSMPARRLGHISYSLYLLQGLVLSVVLGVDSVRAAALASAPAYWVAGALCAVLLLIGASLTHVHVERPGSRLGRRWVRHLDRAGVAPLASAALPDNTPASTATPVDHGPPRSTPA